MFNSDFLFIMLLAFKHTHLISDSDVFLCIFLDFLSFCPPTSLNIVLYPSHYGSYSPQMVPWPTFQGLAHGLSASFDILPCCERISVGSDSVHFLQFLFLPSLLSLNDIRPYITHTMTTPNSRTQLLPVGFLTSLNLLGFASII